MPRARARTTVADGADDARRQRPGGRIAATLMLVLTALACLTGAALLVTGRLDPVQTPPPAASGLHDLNGNPVQLDPGETPPPGPPETGSAGEFGEFAIDAVGLAVPLRGMNAVDGVVTPPGFTSAYLLRNVGVGLDDADSGTVYVAMHSLRGGGKGPGNYLFDVATGASRVGVGDTVRAGAHTYRVTASMTVGKEELPEAASVWNQPPGTLVVITCLQRPEGGPSQSNIILTATLVS